MLRIGQADMGGKNNQPSIKANNAGKQNPAKNFRGKKPKRADHSHVNRGQQLQVLPYRLYVEH